MCLCAYQAWQTRVFKHLAQSNVIIVVDNVHKSWAIQKCMLIKKNKKSLSNRTQLIDISYLFKLTNKIIIIIIYNKKRSKDIPPKPYISLQS